jgi:hypothetical protein
MQNVAIIEIDSPPFWQNVRPGDRIYPRTIPTHQHLEFACELCRTLGGQLKAEGLDCRSPYHYFKFGGGAFTVLMGKKCFSISIGLEPKPTSKTKVIVWVEPQISFLSVAYPPINDFWMRWNTKTWNAFGQRLHKAVELQFEGCPLKWMTDKEWLAELPERRF